jgi:anti-anti-sigma factor
MTGRSRHGLHLVSDKVAFLAGHAPSALPGPGDQSSVSLHLQCVVLALAGRLNAHTAGRLRMFLSMFTVDGGPGELVLDLSDVVAVDSDGMAPIFEAEEVLALRAASLRLAPVSAAVADFLGDARGYPTLVTDRPPDTPQEPVTGRPDDVPPIRDED